MQLLDEAEQVVQLDMQLSHLFEEILAKVPAGHCEAFTHVKLVKKKALQLVQLVALLQIRQGLIHLTQFVPF